MSGHTPGPWYVKELIDYARRLARKAENDLLRVRHGQSASLDCDVCEEGLLLDERDLQEQEVFIFANEHANCGNYVELPTQYDEHGEP